MFKKGFEPIFKDRIPYSSGCGDHIEIEIKKADGFYAYAWNDGGATPMLGGGYECRIPDSLINNFSIYEFNEWLKKNFWNGGTPIIIREVCEEQDVLAFIQKFKT